MVVLSTPRHLWLSGSGPTTLAEGVTIMTIDAASSHTDCPTWCESAHDADELTADRMHYCDLPGVPVIIRDRRSVLAIEVSILAFQKLDEREVWISIGTERGEVSFTVGSLSRLCDQIAEVLDVLAE